jgi:hypothetical protein
MERARWARSAIVAAVLGTLGILTSVSATSAAIWNCPWAKNSTDKIDRGYNSGLHTGLAYYALDLNWYGSDGHGGPSADCGRSVLSVEYGEVNRTSCSDSTSKSGYGCYVEVKHPGKRAITRSCGSGWLAEGRWLARGMRAAYPSTC